MKNALITIALLIVFSLAIQSCGEDKTKTEAPKTEQAPEVVEQTGDGPVAEEPQAETEAPAEEEVAAEAKPSGLADKYYKTPVPGKIVSLSGLVLGNGTVNKAQAKKMIEKAVPLMFMTDAGTVCMVFNTDGSYAGKNLAKYAANKKIGIIGQVKTVNGVKIIIADKIESMD